MKVRFDRGGPFEGPPRSKRTFERSASIEADSQKFRLDRGGSSKGPPRSRRTLKSSASIEADLQKLRLDRGGPSKGPPRSRRTSKRSASIEADPQKFRLDRGGHPKILVPESESSRSIRRIIHYVRDIVPTSGLPPIPILIMRCENLIEMCFLRKSASIEADLQNVRLDRSGRPLRSKRTQPMENKFIKKYKFLNFDG